MEEAAELLGLIERFHGMPRDPDLLRRFCMETLPAGRLLIYGAGTHTARVLDILSGRPDIRVVAVLDRLADGVRTFGGLPVVPPESVRGLQFDHVLAAHTSYEMEMRGTLRGLGVPEGRIVQIYSNPAYRRIAMDLVDALAGQGGSALDCLVVSCSRTVIVPDSTLAGLLPGRTLMAFLGRHDDFFESDAFETVDLRESMTALRHLIAQTRPRIVYVRSIIYKNFIAMAVKAWFPHIVVVHELYDYCTVWPDSDLATLFGLDAATIRLQRAAELYGGQVMDMNLSKRGGVDWARVQHRCPAPYRLFFPQVTEPAGHAPAEGKAGDLLYAGFLPSAAFLRQFRNGYNFLPLMREVCRTGGMTADIFNSAHVEVEGDAIFSNYLSDFAEPPVRYRRRLTYGAMLERMPGYRFGWLCDHQHEFQADRHVGICNRWTGYVSGGLPVLLDGGWRFMGDLVRAYGAGVIVDCLSPDSIVTAIRSADTTGLRRGVTALRRHLLDHNTGVVSDLADLVTTAGRPNSPLNSSAGGMPAAD